MTIHHSLLDTLYNMRFLFSIILIIIFAAVAEYFLPWWTIAPVAFLAAFLMRLKPGKAFLSGFLAIAILWLACSLKADSANDHILSQRMAKLFSLPNSGAFIAVQTFVGALAGGLSAWCGSLLKKR